MPRSMSSVRSISIAVVGVGLVELEHGELGIVPGGQALVAEVAVDLEHPLEAAHHQALQVQLRRDAQVQVHVERIVVGLERTRRRAAGDGAASSASRPR